MSEIKNIQTKIDRSMHARLKHLSDVAGESIKETVRKAISEYLKKHEGKLKEDSIFKLVGSFETREGNWSERKGWRE